MKQNQKFELKVFFTVMMIAFALVTSNLAMVTTFADQDIHNVTYIEPIEVSPVATLAANEIDTTIATGPATITQEYERLEQQQIIATTELNLLEQEMNNIQINSYDVRQITGLSVENMRLLTQGTWLEGQEQALYDLEQTYHINACYAMAVSSLESGCGTSSRARNRRSFYGESTSKKYSSFYENTMYFGDFMSRLYTNVGRISVFSIGPKYCPPNRRWESYMHSYMSEKHQLLMNRINAKYNEKQGAVQQLIDEKESHPVV